VGFLSKEKVNANNFIKLVTPIIVTAYRINRATGTNFRKFTIHLAIFMTQLDRAMMADKILKNT